MRSPVLACGLMFVLLAACSEPSKPSSKTTQQMHAADSGVTSGELGRQRFRCSDGRALLVDFKDGGLQIDVRERRDGPAMTLTAPAQGLQYVGDTTFAVFKDSTLTIGTPDGQTKTCSPAVNP